MGQLVAGMTSGSQIQYRQPNVSMSELMPGDKARRNNKLNLIHYTVAIMAKAQTILAQVSH
eukprot:10336977-Heterocapsa_arctica.AAC.1